MSQSPAILVENLSKKYRLFRSPKERLMEALHPFRKQYHREFWALKDISFQVQPGRTLGIIGRNGSGKSTLLQLICGVLQPTSGVVQANGRVSALLELGAGFNPEFTGRENVMLNGAIMGYSQEEMRNRLPAIEAFAGIGEFVDQPVKTYSSGMFVRLAFAAAINVEPEILIVDEALAVGDVKFQYRCFDKFKELQRLGTTILFVTHSIHTVPRYCHQAILMDKGKIEMLGRPGEVVSRYERMLAQEDAVEIQQEAESSGSGLKETDEIESIRGASTQDAGAEASLPQDPALRRFLSEPCSQERCSQRPSYNPYEERYGTGKIRFVDYMMLVNGQPDAGVVSCGDRLTIYLKVYSEIQAESPLLGFKILDKDGLLVYGSNTEFERIDLPPIGPGETVVYRQEIQVLLNQGDYFVAQGIGNCGRNGRQVLGDHRTGMIHLQVSSAQRFDGVSRMATEFGQEAAIAGGKQTSFSKQ